MDLWCYEEILEWRGEHPGEYSMEEPQYTLAQKLLRSDLANDKCVWTGQFRADLQSYLRNNHSLLSVLFVHDLHPFHRIQRLGVLLSVMGISSLFYYTAYINNTGYFSQGWFNHLLLSLVEIVLISLSMWVVSRFAHCANVQTLGFIERKTQEILSSIVVFVFVAFGLTMGMITLQLTLFNPNRNNNNNNEFGMSFFLNFILVYCLSLWTELWYDSVYFTYLWTKERRQTRELALVSSSGASSRLRNAKSKNAVSNFHVTFLEYIDCIVKQKEHWKSQSFRQRRSMLTKNHHHSPTAQRLLAQHQRHKNHAKINQTLKGIQNWTRNAAVKIQDSIKNKRPRFKMIGKNDNDHRRLEQTADITEILSNGEENPDITTVMDNDDSIVVTAPTHELNDHLRRVSGYQTIESSSEVLTSVVPNDEYEIRDGLDHYDDELECYYSSSSPLSVDGEFNYNNMEHQMRKRFERNESIPDGI